jgi:hypothetical protein
MPSNFSPAEPADQDIRTKLRRLDRRDWWRIAVGAVITLLLTCGIFFSDFPGVSLLPGSGRFLHLSSLLAIVLLFDIFAIYQQLAIVRLRRQLGSHLAMSATLEALAAAAPDDRKGWRHLREHPRYYMDRRVALHTVRNGKHATLQARTRDISEGGIGAAVPEPLEAGERIELEVKLESGSLTLPAIVMHRRGYHHGIRFVEITPEQRKAIREACSGAEEVFDFRRNSSVSAQAV